MSTTRRLLTLAIAAFLTSPLHAAGLSKYLPDDTEIVLGMEVTAVMESGVVTNNVPTLLKQYGRSLFKLCLDASGQKIDEDLLKAITKPLTDADTVRKWLADNKSVVRRVLIGASADLGDDNVFVVVEGAFGKGKGKEWFDGLIKYKPIGLAVKPLKEGKHEFWSLQTAGSDEAMFVAQADATTVIGCQSKDVLLKALSRSGRDKLAVKEKLIEVANRIDPKANLWMAAAPKEMDEYVTAHASIIVTDGIKVVATVTNKDADAARNMVSDLKEEMKDLADLLDDAAKQLPPLAAVRDVLKTIEPKAEKNVVTFEVELTGASIDQLIKKLGGAR